MKNQSENEKMINQVNDALIDLRNRVKKKKFLKMKIPMKQLILWKKSLTLTNNNKVKGSKY